MATNCFNGRLYININNLLNNLERFNADYETNFSLATSIEDVQIFFQDEYNSLCNDDIPINFDNVQRFNDLFSPYAYMMK